MQGITSHLVRTPTLTCLVSLFTKMDTNARSSKRLWENSVTLCCHSTLSPLITTSAQANQTFRVRRTLHIARQWQYCKTCKKSPLRRGELRLMFTLKSKVSEHPSVVVPFWCECMSFRFFASAVITLSRKAARLVRLRSQFSGFSNMYNLIACIRLLADVKMCTDFETM